MSSKHQTKSYLRRRLDEIGIRPNARHGQNFLIDLNLLDVLVRVADLQPHDVVLEVGTGTGSLTARLVERVAAVVSVEIDASLAQLAGEQLSSAANLTILQQDALRNKNNLHPHVIEVVQQRLAEHPDSRFKLVANLPYNIATPLISNLLDSPIVPHSMAVTIQKELADRLVAHPGTKDFGSLSVWVQSQCYTAIARLLPPDVFWPRPKVTSAFVSIVLDPAKRAQIEDLQFFHSFVRAMFQHRRKFLRGVLRSALKPHLDKSAVDRLLADQQLDPESRAEQLSIEQFIKLAQSAQSMINATSADPA